jgi:hypothetical protein
MPSLKAIVEIAKGVGWEYRGYQDCSQMGMEYSYLLEFVHP